MKLYLTRHGQTNYNISGILDSSLSEKVHLTDEGITQTEQLAIKLKDIKFDVVFISELFRTKQTAEIINRYHNAPLIVEPLLNELRTGYESKPYVEWKEAIKRSDDMWNETFDGGEGLIGAVHRTEAFIEKVKRSGHEHVLIVTHGFIVQVMDTLLLGRPYTESFEHNVEQGEYAEFTL